MRNQKILLVEGKDDEHVLSHICGSKEIELDKIEQCGGIDNLKTKIRTLGFGEESDNDESDNIVGVIVDADLDVRSRWQAIRNLVSGTGYKDVPSNLNPNGMIFDSSDADRAYLPRLGVWVMPNNQMNGTLEDFLHFLVPQPSDLLDHVKQSVRTFPDGQRRFKDPAESKAIIHTWLAWQEKPGLPFGRAITKRFLDPDVQEVNDLVSWIRRLYFLD